MKVSRATLAALVLSAVLAGCTSVPRTEPVTVIPQPVSMTKPGDRLHKIKGKVLTKIDTTIVGGSEAYRLSIKDGRVAITAGGPAGELYARQTLAQIEQDGRVPDITIEDAPRFEWRGLMFDVSRHFQGPEYIKRLLDMMVYHKLNTFHWHLTDGVGWRIQIDKYPLLTQQGAWRNVPDESVPWIGFKLASQDEEYTHGGYYTKDQIRDVVAYAAERHITIIPEIEMPGHSDAATTCYPQFSCGGKYPANGVYCPGNDSTFIFLEGIIDEVVELFPGEFIHIGGDEVGKELWSQCPDCQARMKKEGLSNEHELQSYFVKRMENYIRSKGRRMIGWDEISEGGLSSSAAVMSWTGMENGIKAANTDHDVVMCPLDYVYLDHYQGYNPFEPQGWGGYNGLHRVYDFPVMPAGIDSSKSYYIKGGQGNLWTETIQDTAHVEYMLLPRLSALSEVLWSPASEHDWDRFVEKVDRQVDRYTARGWNYAQSAMTPMVMAQRVLPNGEISLQIDTEMGTYPIHYTTDGTDPSVTSPLYTDSIVIDKACDLRASAFRNDIAVGYMLTIPRLLNKATGARVIYTTPCGPGYFGGGAAGLVDNRYAIKRGDDGAWQGFEGQDMDVTIDLGEATVLSGADLRFFQHTSTTSVMLPTHVKVLLSDDNKAFREVALLDIPTDENLNAFVQNFKVDWSEQAARYVRVVASNRGTLPAGLPRGGNKAWVFTDEIALY